MIIKCDSCNTKFRLDGTKVKGRGVKVRCTKCQNIFVVAPPELEEVKGTVETSFAAPGEEKEEEKMAPSGEEEREEAGEEGLLGRQPVSTEIEHGFDFGAGVPSMEEKAGKGEEEFVFGEMGREGDGNAGWGGGEESEKVSFEEKSKEKAEEFPVGEEEFTLLTDKKEEGLSAETEEESYGFAPELEKTGLEEEAAEKPEGFSGLDYKSLEKELPRRTPKKPAAQTASTSDFIAEEEKEEERSHPKAAVGKAAKGNKIKVLFVLIIVIAGAAVYLTGGIERLLNTMGIQRGVSPQKTMDIAKLRGYPLENSVIGSLFVIEGRILSFSDKPENIKGIKGALFDKAGKQVAARIVSPGRVVSAQKLKSIKRVDLERRFRGSTAAVIPAKGSVPFMVVFYKEPTDLAEYTVEVLK